MNHQEAAALGMVERYLLDELTPQERDAFEEHYFSCANCGEDVQSGWRLIEGIKARPAVPPVSMPPPRRLGVPFWLASAFGFLLCVSGYQNLRLQTRMEDPYVADSPKALHMGSRAGAKSLLKVPSDKPLLLSVDVPVESRWSGYEIRILKPGGGKVAQFDVTTSQASEPVTVVFPKEAVRPGAYSVDVYGMTAGGAAQKLQGESFVIQ